MNDNKAVFGSDVKRLPLKDLLKRIGPGLVATGIVIGPGAVTTAAMLGGLFILLLIWRKDVNEGYKSPTALRICMTISYIFALFMTGSALQGQLPKLMALFGL